MLLSGRPRFHIGQTIGTTQAASSIINPSPSVFSMGDLLRASLREFVSPAQCLIEPNTGRLYVFPHLSSATPDFFSELDTLSLDVALQPDGGQSGPILAWSRSPGSWPLEPAGAALAYTAVKPKRTVGSLLNALCIAIAAEDGGVAPVIHVDQTTGRVNIYRGSAGQITAAVAAWDAVETPTGTMLHLYLTPGQGGPGRDQYFESGPP